MIVTILSLPPGEPLAVLVTPLLYESRRFLHILKGVIVVNW